MFNEDRLPMPDISSVEQCTEVIKGLDGNDITLYIAKPKGASAAPGMVYLHGGGMAAFSADDHLYRIFRALFAMRGFVVVSVDFRNSTGKFGNHPYPAALNDGMSALSWAHANRAELGISKLILCGESGGGNLCTAMAIRAKREGKLHEFDGVFAFCPFIGGPKVWQACSLQSLRECHNSFVDIEQFKIFGRLYDPEGKHEHDPCAWPFAAELSDLEGLPPHFINVNELDPLRDEGLSYYEKLRDAGVRAEKRVAEGTQHGGDFAAGLVPGAESLFEEVVCAMKTFVESL